MNKMFTKVITVHAENLRITIYTIYTIQNLHDSNARGNRVTIYFTRFVFCQLSEIWIV